MNFGIEELSCLAFDIFSFKFFIKLELRFHITLDQQQRCGR